ncbi:MAG: hypothetical protein O3A51_04670 [Verrucomicrobia bacterium]|nr:hypothetical protein [Verrucomicrobiota bacterium]
MLSCYLLMAGSFVGILLTGLQGYCHISIAGAGHAHVALVTIILYMFTESLIMFFFIGTGVNIKEYVRDEKKDPAFYDRVKVMKMSVFPKIMMSILLVGVVFIIGGAVDRNLMPAWIHGALFFVALGHYGHVIVVQHRCFKENTAIIVEMCRAAAPES